MESLFVTTAAGGIDAVRDLLTDLMEARVVELGADRGEPPTIDTSQGGGPRISSPSDIDWHNYLTFFIDGQQMVKTEVGHRKIVAVTLMVEPRIGLDDLARDDLLITLGRLDADASKRRPLIALKPSIEWKASGELTVFFHD